MRLGAIALLLLVVAGLLATGAHGGNGAVDALSLRYTGGAAADGVVTTRCVAPFLAVSGAAGPLTIDARQVEWEEVRTERVLLPGADEVWSAAMDEPSGVYGAGRITVTFAPSGNAWVFPHRTSGDGGASSGDEVDDEVDDEGDHEPWLDAETTGAVWTPVASGRSTVEHFEHRERAAGHDTSVERPFLRTPLVEGPTRELAFTDGTMRVSGALSLLVRHATISFPDATWTLPEHVRTTTGPDGVTPREVHTDGWLHLRGGTLETDAAAVLATCRAMQQHVLGEVSWRDATGTFRLGTDERSVGPGIVTAHGDLSLDDVPEQRGARINGEGTLEWAATDRTVFAALVKGPAVVLGGLALLAVAAHRLVPSLVLLYSRLAENRLLDHPTRRLLMDHITANPGTNVHAAARALDLPRGSVRHHLRILSDARLVVRHRLEGEVLLVAAGDDGCIGLRHAVVAAKGPARCLATTTRGSPVAKRDLVALLCRLFEMSESGARKWILRCERLGIIVPEGRGHGVSYRCGL